MLEVDPCCRKSITREFHEVLDSRTFSEHFFDNLLGIPSRASQPSLCSCKPPCPPFSADLIAPPVIAYAKLRPDYDWPHDMSYESGILQWVADRLREFCFHNSTWTVTLPRLAREREFNESVRRFTSSSSVFTFNTISLPIRRGEKGSYMRRLVRYKLPKHDILHPSDKTSLLLVYRTDLPRDSLRRFPPLNCSLTTLFDNPKRRAKWAPVFEAFRGCEVETTLVGAGGPDDLIKLKTVEKLNGITVAYMCMDVHGSADLLGDWKTGHLITQDILANPGSAILYGDVEGRQPLVEQGLRLAIDKLLCQASQLQVPFSLQSLSYRISNLFQAYACRSTSTKQERPSPLELCRDLLGIFCVVPTSEPSPTPFPVSFTSCCTASHVGTSWLSSAGLVYGCAVGTVTALTLDRVRKRERRMEKVVDYSDLVGELVQNFTAILSTALMPGSVTIATEATRGVFRRFLQRRFAEATLNDFREILHMLDHMGDSFATIMESYDSVLDTHHILVHFNQAFMITASRGQTECSANEIINWFQLSDRSGKLVSLIPTHAVRLNGHYGDMLIRDLFTANMVRYNSGSLQKMLENAIQSSQEPSLTTSQSAKPSTDPPTPTTGLTKPSVDLTKASSGSHPPTPTHSSLRLSASYAIALIAVLLAVHSMSWLLDAQWAKDTVTIETRPPPRTAARVLREYKISSAVTVLPDDIVYIIRSPIQDWLNIEDAAGSPGV